MCKLSAVTQNHTPIACNRERSALRCGSVALKHAVGDDDSGAPIHMKRAATQSHVVGEVRVGNIEVPSLSHHCTTTSSSRPTVVRELARLDSSTCPSVNDDGGATVTRENTIFDAHRAGDTYRWCVITRLEDQAPHDYGRCPCQDVDHCAAQARRLSTPARRRADAAYDRTAAALQDDLTWVGAAEGEQL